MRILIATGLYPPDIGGPSTYTLFLEKHLPKFGHSLKVRSFTSVRKYPKLVRHIIYFSLLFRDAFTSDIIISLDTISVGIPATLVSFLLRKKHILRVPGDYAWEQGQQRFGVSQTLDEYLKSPNKPLRVRVLASLQLLVARLATHIIVPSEYLKNVVVSWGVNSNKITRIYSSLKVINVHESKNELRSKFNYNNFVIVTAARLTPWKGVKALISAIYQLRKAGYNISLVVIGDGTERNNLVQYVQELDIEKFVHFLGVLDRAILGKHVKAADAFVLNTSYEGLSHQLLEVMHIGTPVITTPVGGNLELIEHDFNGVFVQFNDIQQISNAVLRLYENEQLRTVIAKNAMVTVKNFHEDIIVDELNILLKSYEKP